MILDNFRELPRSHKALATACLMLLTGQGAYLSRYALRTTYEAFVSRPYPETPINCPYIEDNSGPPPAGLGGGGVQFNVDMRCAPPLRSGVLEALYVTGPFCNNCGPEGWNVLTDPNGDGYFAVEIDFTKQGPFEEPRYGVRKVAPKNEEAPPLIGASVLYRYVALYDSPLGSWGQIETLSDDVDRGAKCAVAKDDLEYLRLAVTEPWAVSVWDVFGSCTDVQVTPEQVAESMARKHEELNPWIAENIDPWHRPLLSGFDRVLLLDPTFYLTLCTVVYVLSGAVLGGGFARRKETALLSAMAVIQKKNTYVEHAAKIMRHDMFSGIEMYLPRGVSSIEKRMEKHPKEAARMRLDAPLRMLRESLEHTQQVYRGAREFTNLLRGDAPIETEETDAGKALREYLTRTAYQDQVVVEDLPQLMLSPNLFCTAIDNLIRNGLTYNDSPSKKVVVKMWDEDTLAVIDNGRGLTQKDFEVYSKAYTRKQGQKEKGTGLGLNICIAILQEHGFEVSSELRADGPGTVIKVTLR